MYSGICQFAVRVLTVAQFVCSFLILDADVMLPLLTVFYVGYTSYEYCNFSFYFVPKLSAKTYIVWQRVIE